MSKKKHNGCIAAEKTFYSLKNQTQISYRTQAESMLMAQLEYDTTVDSYQPFQTQAINQQTSTELEASMGFIVNRSGNEEAVIISDILALSQKRSHGTSPGMQMPPRPADGGANGIKPLKLTALRPNDITSSILARNVSFLYPFVLNLPSIENCRAVQDYFSFTEETSIRRLKTFLKIENEIYFLLFHFGLRANLAVELLTDETIVRIGPLMGAVVKELAQGEAAS